MPDQSKLAAGFMKKLLLFMTLPLYALDQWTKWLIEQNFAEPTPHAIESKTIIPGFFDLVRLHNRGIAFGKFDDLTHANIIFFLVAVFALGFIFYLWKKNAFPTKLSQVAVALLVSGVLGNVTDRIVRGYVVDFLSFDLQFMVWPSFNVADSCICVAAFFLFLSAFQADPSNAETERASAS